MLVAYYRRRGTGFGLIDPSEDPETAEMFKRDGGIGGLDRERIARKLGFQAKYLSLTPEGVWRMLCDGPIIYAGLWAHYRAGHWVVITGVSTTGELTITNPVGRVEHWDFDFFMGRYLAQSELQPLIYASGLNV